MQLRYEYVEWRREIQVTNGMATFTLSMPHAPCTVPVKTKRFAVPVRTQQLHMRRLLAQRNTDTEVIH